MTYAASGDTWGITGPDFLLIYLAAALAAVVGAAITRAVLAEGRFDRRVGMLHPQQVAYLNDGAELAVHAALAGLRRAGAIGVGDETRLRQTGPLPAGATALDAAVHGASATPTRVRNLRAHPAVADAIEAVRSGLARAGLLAGPVRRRAYRLAALLLVPVILVGVARIGADRADGKPVGVLIAVVSGSVLWLLVGLTRTLDRTRVADRALGGSSCGGSGGGCGGDSCGGCGGCGD